MTSSIGGRTLGAEASRRRCSRRAVDKIADAVLRLHSDCAGFVVGQSIAVDGGSTIGGIAKSTDHPGKNGSQHETNESTE
ncbi:MAG TPA: hypothetical protein PKH69_08360 [Thiobacillaceae bacterium]|nr:hypothetical protein [Thiobacillaceae bacterium]HNU64618.1 hypothetical protein [Thiobacillaceae bacterium]